MILCFLIAIAAFIMILSGDIIFSILVVISQEIIDGIIKLFYNFIMPFQDKSELENNPEWIKFIESTKTRSK